MKIKFLFQFLLLLSLLITACEGSSVNKDITPTPDLRSTATQELMSEKSALVGVIVDSKGNPIENIGVHLAVIVWNEDKSEGAFFLDIARSPGTFTKTDGIFIVNNVDPGEYAVIVGDAMDKNVVIREDDQVRTKVYTLTNGSVLDIGKLTVTFP